jgi:hypothetical protein
MSIIVDNKQSNFTMDDVVAVIIGDPGHRTSCDQWKLFVGSIIAIDLGMLINQSINQSINQPTNRSPSTGGADQALDGLRERRTKASKSEEGVYHLDTNPSTPVYIGFSMAASMAPLGLVIAAIGVVLVYNAQVVEILIDAKKSRV